MIEKLTILLIYFGAIVMLFSILETRHLLIFIKENKYKSAWVMLWSLMIFFLLGYIIVMLLLSNQIYHFSTILIGIIFFFGAIFVYLVVKTGFLTIKDLVKTNISNKELEKSKQIAEATAKAKSTFLAVMSHEIRTPMNGILGMTDLLLDTDLNETQRDFLETIRSNNELLLTIINDILDLSKIEAGKLNMEENPFEIRSCLEDVISLFTPKANEKKLDLIYYIETNVPKFIKGDANRLRQIIFNLVNNGLKFTYKGEIFIYVSQISNNKFLFSVKDTGIGISKEKIKLLFKPFSQADNSISRQYGGTGLGLAICKKLTNLMGGDIWVESELNFGTTFYFTIDAKPVNIILNKTFEANQFRGKRVLLLDKNSTFAKVLALDLESLSMIVSVYQNPLEALKAIRGNSCFDLVMVDIDFPSFNTCQLVVEIKKLGMINPLPVVGLTYRKKNFSLEKSCNCFIATLFKPIKYSQLINTLKLVFDNSISSDSGNFNSNFSHGKKVAVNSSNSLSMNQESSHSFPLKILVAEDNDINQKLIRLMFNKLGYEIDIANNGVEVITLAKINNYDLIFMDIQMPEVDGLTATRHLIQELSENKLPVIVAMTANVMESDKIKCFQVGMKDYISKPINLEEIQRVISHWG